MAAKFEYSIRSKDETQQGIKSAKTGLESLEGSMKSINKVAATLMGAGAIAGVVMALRKLYQGAAEAEKAFAALHPETQKAAGSLADWNTAMKNMQADAGGVVAKILTPIRQALLDIIDPAHEARLAIQGLTDEVSGWGKYTSAATKAADQIKAARDALVAAKAAKGDISVQISEYQRMLTQLGKRPDFGERALKYQNQGYDSSYAQSQATIDIANYDQSKQFLEGTIATLRRSLEQANTAIREIPIWLDEQTKGGKPPSKPETSTPSTPAVDPFEMLDFLRDAATWQYFPISERGGTKGSSRGAVTSESDTGGKGNNEGEDSEKKQTFSEFLDSISGITSQFQSLTMILNPVNTIMNAFWEALRPMVDELLGPLVGALVIIGQTMAAVIAPVLQILAPVITFLADAFVFLYNKAIVPIANVFITLFKVLSAFAQVLFYLVTFQWGKLAGVTVDTSSGMLQPISTDTLGSAGAATMNGGGQSGVYSSGRDITVNVVVNTDIITGDGGIRELALVINREIQNAIALGVA